MNSKHFHKNTGLCFGAAFNHYMLWNWYGFWCGIVLVISVFGYGFLTKEIICCSSLYSFLMSFIMSSILRCNSLPKMISSYPQS